MNPDGQFIVSQAQQVAAVVATLIPLVIALIVQDYWSTKTKTLVSLAVVIVFACIVLWFDGRWNPQNVGGTVLAVFVLVTGTYEHFWKKNGVAPAIERSTSLPPPHANE